MKYRTEHDSMGEVRVPAAALYGAQTQRAVDNFRISAQPMPPRFIRALARVKAAAATANGELEALERPIADALVLAAQQVVSGEHVEEFPVPVLQTGSGTSSNMNMNEVLAQLASVASGRDIHPNDHANCSQSSNDVIPAALQVACSCAVQDELLPALTALVTLLEHRAGEFDDVVKTGRTHLMDAMPVTLGMELRTYALQLQECGLRFADLSPRLQSLPLGGSAVGTGVNVPGGFAAAAVAEIARDTRISFTLCPLPSVRMAAQDASVECSACLRSLALVLIKMANDLRWMASGPLAGLGEIQLRALQPGSSIMPGKVNPVLAEAVLMAATQVIGNDTAIALAGQSGNFQLNVMLPLIADKLLESISLLQNSCASMGECIEGIEPQRDHAAATLARNPILVTALNTEIGYEAAAKIAKLAYQQGRPILDVAVEQTGLERAVLAALLDPAKLAVPGGSSG